MLVIARKILLNFQVRDCVLKFLPKNGQKRPFLAKIESTTVSPVGETMYDSNFRTFNFPEYQPFGLDIRPIGPVLVIPALRAVFGPIGPIFKKFSPQLRRISRSKIAMYNFWTFGPDNRAQMSSKFDQ